MRILKRKMYIKYVITYIGRGLLVVLLYEKGHADAVKIGFVTELAAVEWLSFHLVPPKLLLWRMYLMLLLKWSIFTVTAFLRSPADLAARRYRTARRKKLKEN